MLAVGDELLNGRTADTNSAFVGRVLAERGLRLQRTTHLPDDHRAIGTELKAALGRSQVVIVSGGLGPTDDDRTVDAVAAALERPVVVHRPTLARVQKLFRRRGVTMPAVAERQARIVAGAEVLVNPVGMAPGMILGLNGQTVLLLPGVPEELESILPMVVQQISSRLGLRSQHRIVVRTTGRPESVLAQQIAPLIRRQPGVVAGWYPATSGVDIVLSGADQARVRRCAAAIARRLTSSVYEVGERRLEEVVGDKLCRLGLTVGTAESCTGGLVADRLTDVAGSSRYFRGGLIAYSNDVKQQVLGVSAESLRRYGAVSRTVAAQMARGACRVLNSDVAVATTGIAGPTGGSKAKPVGLVWLAVCCRGRVRTERWLHNGNRRMVKERSAAAALDLLRRVIVDWQR